MKKLGPTQPRSGIRFKFGRRGKNPVAGEVNGTVKHVTPTKKKKSLALRQFDVVPISGSMMRSVVSEKIGTPAENMVPSLLIGLSSLPSEENAIACSGWV